MGETNQSEEPISVITGDKVGLAPLSRDTVHLDVKWFNDLEIAALNGLPLRPTTRESLKDLLPGR